MSTFAKRLKEARLEKNLTQDELAVLAGVSQSLINKIENGHANESRKTPQLAAALGVNTDWLAKGVGDKYPIARHSLTDKHDKNVMALTDTVELPIESLSSRAGGFKPDRTFPTLGPAQARERRGLANSQSDSIKEMISDIEVTSHAYKYIARGIGMMPEINDGDTVLVEPGIEPDDSDMVLVEINGDQCIMQHWRVAGEAWLTFSNPAFAELKQPFSSALFLGVVLAKLHAPTRLSRR